MENEIVRRISYTSAQTYVRLPILITILKETRVNPLIYRIIKITIKFTVDT